MPRKFCTKSHKSYKKVLRGTWRDFIRKFKDLRCSKCGYDKCLSALDFHHLDPRTKSLSISQFIALQPFNRINKVRIFDELQKCIVLCSNCHRELHYANKE